MRSLIVAFVLLASPALAAPAPSIQECASTCSYKNGSCSGDCNKFLVSCFKSKTGNSCYCGTFNEDGTPREGMTHVRYPAEVTSD